MKMTEAVLPWPNSDKWKFSALGILGAFILLMANISIVMKGPVEVAVPQAAEGDGDSSNGEAWCDANPANCVCSETLTMTDYIRPDGTLSSANPAHESEYWNPINSTSNECSWIRGGGQGGSNTGFFIGTAARHVQPSDSVTTFNTSGAIENAEAYDLASLPNRVASQAPRFQGRGMKNLMSGRFWPARIGFLEYPAFANHRSRRAFRWYIYWNDDFVFRGGGEQNTKMWEALTGGYFTQGGNPPTSLSRSSSNTRDPWTCDNGSHIGGSKVQMSSGIFGQSAFNASDFVGKWWRFEVVVDNAKVYNSDPGAGNGTRFRLFAKNVSENTQEETWIDSYNVTGGSSNSNPNGPKINNSAYTCGGFSDMFNPGEDWDEWKISGFTQSNSGSGTEQKSYAFYQMAAWTDAEMSGFDLYGADVWNKTDFRIGSSFEMEGLVGDTS